VSVAHDVEEVDVSITSNGRLEPIDRAECERLLASHHLGRLAVVLDGQPLIFPVNYASTPGAVVFRTDAGTKLLGADGKRVAFEIDGADSRYHNGWSVLVVGIAREERDERRKHELERLPLRPWCSGAKGHWMTIGIGAITGRRITRDLDLARREEQ
jgi:hypothetical protein